MGGLVKKTVTKYMVDCQQPCEDNIMDISQLEKYYQDRIKVNGKTGNLGELIKIGKEKNKVTVSVSSAREVLEAVHQVLDEEVPEEAELARFLARYRPEEGRVPAQVLQHQQQ